MTQAIDESRTAASPVPPILSAAEVGALRARGGARNLIDVRTPSEFESVHAEGAKLVPLDHFDPRAVASATVAPNEPLFLLCKTGGRASRARDMCLAAGLNNVVCVDGGTDAWIRAGLPVVRGRQTISLERQVRIVAGALVLIGVVLGVEVSLWFLGLAGFVGAGLMFAGITDWCGMGMLLAKMPWNQRGGS
jgi:rhodanese-related sulfurtransferase